MDFKTEPLSHELFLAMKAHPGAEVVYFNFTPISLKLYEDHAKALRASGYRVVSSTTEIDGEPYTCMVAVGGAGKKTKRQIAEEHIQEWATAHPEEWANHVGAGRSVASYLDDYWDKYENGGIYECLCFDFEIEPKI